MGVKLSIPPPPPPPLTHTPTEPYIYGSAPPFGFGYTQLHECFIMTSPRSTILYCYITDVEDCARAEHGTSCLCKMVAVEGAIIIEFRKVHTEEYMLHRDRDYKVKQKEA